MFGRNDKYFPTLRNPFINLPSVYKQPKEMTVFLIILGALLVTNYLLLQFSCNDTTEADSPKDE